jgi:hypothetical protein
LDVEFEVRVNENALHLNIPGTPGHGGNQTLCPPFKSHLGQHPSLKADHTLLVSIPGIGEWTAARLLSEMACWGQLESSRQAAAHPRQQNKHVQ